MITVKWLLPARKMWHFFMAHATARHSNSITAYLLSVSVKNLDPACTSFHSESFSSDFCMSRNPSPSVLA